MSRFTSSTSYFKSLTVVVSALFFFSFLGCDQEESLSNEDPIEASEEAMSLSYGAPVNMTEQERKKATPYKDGSIDFERSVEITNSFNLIAGSSDDWKEAHERVQTRLEETNSTIVPRFLREQAAAHAMYRHVFSGWENEIPSEKQEVLAEYTELLVKNRSPESAFVHSGLKRLRGYWSEEKIARVADTALAAAERAYGPEKTDAEEPRDATTPGLSQIERAHKNRIQNVNDSLRRLAEGLD